MEKIFPMKIISKVVSDNHIRINRSQLTLKMSGFKKNIFAFGNKEQTKILFSILIDNAINYSIPNTDITISLSTNNKNILIQIKDQGIGIAEKNISKIFKEYFRSNNAVDIHENGSGLGLAIASEIISINKYKIKVESTLGKGTSFFVTMPIKPF